MIATSKRIDISGVDAKTVEKVSTPDYFTKEKKAEKKSEEAFFKQGEKPEVRFSLCLWIYGSGDHKVELS